MLQNINQFQFSKKVILKIRRRLSVSCNFQTPIISMYKKKFGNTGCRFSVEACSNFKLEYIQELQTLKCLSLPDIQIQI